MTVMEKVDLKKALKAFYNSSAKQCVIVDVPAMNFLMLDGAGDPNTSPAFQAAVETLYAVSYTLKFMLKKQGAADYAVMPLEGLWWTPDMAEFTIADKSNWLWTIMIAQPSFITAEQVASAKGEARKKELSLIDPLRFESYHEGLAAQIMHLGPFAAEGPTIAKLHAFIAEQGYKLTGKHHEIYLSDFRRTAPEKLKTVIRQPVGHA
jgi:hypothetical protein